MSDIKIWNQTKKTLHKPQSLTNQMQSIVEEASLEVFGVRIMASNYVINQNNNEVIPTLGLDENNTLVVFEYRQGKFGKVVDKAFVFVDYIKTNISKIRMLLQEKLSNEEIRGVCFDARIIVIGDDFNRYDDYAIKQLPIQIDLIKIQTFSPSLVAFEKNYHSKTIDHTRFAYHFNNQSIKMLYEAIKEFVLSLGDEVVEVGIGSGLCYRKIKHFMYLDLEEAITCSVIIKNNFKSFKIKTMQDFTKYKALIETSYDEN